MLSTILWSVATIAVTLLITGSQKYLSTRKIWLTGAIIPLLTLIAAASVYFSLEKAMTIQFIVPCAIIIALELFIWADGRRQYRKAELLRMKAIDIR
ncbi:MAG: hypothetical protein Q4C56_05025 [Peptococcaceae bacterium]|nr:hypothetical protein [Peptococcaceae bacterium]